jgi:hypothetical protein
MLGFDSCDYREQSIECVLLRREVFSIGGECVVHVEPIDSEEALFPISELLKHRRFVPEVASVQHSKRRVSFLPLDEKHDGARAMISFD